MSGKRTLKSTRRWNAWCRALGLVAMALVALPLLPATGQASGVSQLLDLVNQDRAAHGASPVALSSTLNNIAQQQANGMASAGRIFQNSAFPGDVPAANSAGENVGYGPDVVTVHNAFVASPEHQVIIVDNKYRYVGIALANSPVGLMVVEEFVDTVGGLSVATSGPSTPASLESPAKPAPAPAAPVPPPASPPQAPKPAPAPPAAPPSPPPPPPVAAAAAPPAPAPPPPPPPPPTLDTALYSRMLQWEQWQTAS